MAADLDTQEMLIKMKPQTDEFDALDELITIYNNLPAIIDDDYPRARRHYESAIKTLLEACKNNGRI